MFLIDLRGDTAVNRSCVQVVFSGPLLYWHVGISVAWLGLGFNYYTAYSSE